MMADEDYTMSEIYKDLHPMVFSRIPVFHDHPDNITGLILKDNILENLAQDRHQVKASDIKRDILFVEDSYSVAKLMDTLILNREHLHGGRQFWKLSGWLPWRTFLRHF